MKKILDFKTVSAAKSGDYCQVLFHDDLDADDEPLRGKWKGHRFPGLNIQYRATYKIDRQNVLVMVEKVTPHDFRRNSNERAP